MSFDDESGNSIPYIDDTTTCEDDNVQDDSRHSVSVTEKYQNRNRIIRIRNRSRDGIPVDYATPVAPLAEIDLMNDGFDEQEEKPECHSYKRVPSKDSIMKLVIKGWNSSVSIQGLDNKSSITLKRRGDRVRQERDIKTADTANETSESRKQRKKKWKMLTKSFVSKSARCERRGPDERYPKYVLLKNEEEEDKEKEMGKRKINKKERERETLRKGDSYPKMVVLSERRSLRSDNKERKKILEKPEFHFKRSFKNKTNPLQVTDEAQAERNNNDEKTPGREDKDNIFQQRKRDSSGRKKDRNKSTEKRESSVSKTGHQIGQSSSQDNVFNEIEGVLKEAIELYQEAPSLQPDRQQEAMCRFCAAPHPPYLSNRHRGPCYATYEGTGNPCKQTNIQLNPDNRHEDVDDSEFQNIQIGILSTFFPQPVMIMKAYSHDYPDVENGQQALEASRNEPEPPSAQEETERKENVHVEGNQSPTLIDSLPDLQITSKPLPEGERFQLNVSDGLSASSSDDNNRQKTEETETTQYLHYDNENKAPDTESTTTTTCTIKTDETTDENKQQNGDDKGLTEENGNNGNLSLTQIGYKMYDNLTKMSLKREREAVHEEVKPEVGAEIRSSPCNITFESKDSVIRIVVPDKRLNLQFVKGDARPPDIRIGFQLKPENKPEVKQETENGKVVVWKKELWHSDGAPSATPKEVTIGKAEEYQKINLSIADQDDVYLSIETREKMERKLEPTKILTKEMNVGTEDLETGNSKRSGREDFRNLSPRKGKLLRNLKEKLEERGKMTNHVAPGVTPGHRCNRSDMRNEYPGIFLVRPICRGPRDGGKPFEVSSYRKTPSKEPAQGGELREYYCEDCLATMRIFEDENPSVKSMVDKFETIIQLETF